MENAISETRFLRLPQVYRCQPKFPIILLKTIHMLIKQTQYFDDSPSLN